MPLTPGTRLGPYEILTALGAGGMGEVYKARDTRLDRIVAIKVSKENFSERFEREARVIAALNHPNICQLYDVGPNYLVMEYIEGSPITPADSTRKLLDIAVQIADGLAAAHAAGIVHRDLKPDNIFIARDGRVRILDFGLAKTLAGSDPDKTALTDAGTTIGTIAYMSPEQARGNPDLTPQSDQFSLGLVLYELANGKRAFQRDSAAEIMTAIIREEFEPLPATVPAPFRWIVERLLAKEPADRYDSTRDLHRELRQLRDRLSESTSVSATVPVLSSHKPVPATLSRGWLLAAGSIAILAAAAAWTLHPAAGVGHYRFTPMEVSWENPADAVWSPDGNAFAYSAGAERDRHVFLRYLNSPNATPLTPGADDWAPVGWSPDGRRVIARGKNPKGAKPASALFSIPVFGGEPELIAPLDYDHVTVSPDGKALAALHQDEHGHLAVYTASSVGSALKRYLPAPFESSLVINSPSLRFSPDGKSISLIIDLLGGRQAWRLPYPAGQGTTRRILTDLATSGGTPGWSWFPDGRSGVLSLADEQERSTHLWFAGVSSGARRQVTTGTSSESDPAVSPDGQKILFVQSGADYMILSASLADATVKRVISSQSGTGMPAWALRQNKFAYESDRSGSPAIWMRSEGWDRPIVTVDAFPPASTVVFMDPALSPEADRLVFTRGDRNQRFLIWISSVSGGSPVPLTNVDANETVEIGGAWSPDGNSIVYLQFSKGRSSLMVVKPSGEAVPVSLRQNIAFYLPEWSPDGQWIKFRDKSDEAGWSIMSPDGKTLRSFGEPKTLQMTFSSDSKRLYGIRPDQDHSYLFSLDIATKEEKIIGDIGKDFTPSSYGNPGIRLSLSPDGKSILFPSVRRNSSLWMLEGFDPPGWLDRLRELRPW